MSKHFHLAGQPARTDRMRPQQSNILLVLLCLIPLNSWAGDFTTIQFPSTDGLTITADLYLAHPDLQAPFIVLFHQAGWSRGEYREIAPRLNALGFNTMAIDQRAGGAVNGVTNATAILARQHGKSSDYIDAMQDLRAALLYARHHYAEGQLIAWGSSYSAALVLVLAGENPPLADATLSFSPGEYFTSLGKPEHWVASAAASIRRPVFITSARAEQGAWADIYAAIPGVKKTAYRPLAPGHHGSRSLWEQFPEHAGYWRALQDFLQKYAKHAGPVE